MSWFIALVPKKSPFLETDIHRYGKRLCAISNVPYRLNVTRPEIILLAGGLPETFQFKSSSRDEAKSGWFVCGTGIKNSGGSFSAMHQDDWDCLLRGDVSAGKIHEVDGHYVAATWNAGKMEIFVDPLELRRAYVADTGDLYVASSRVDWIIPFLPDPEFSLEAVASGWHLINSFSDGSFVRGVIRVGPSGHVDINKGAFRHSWRHWEPGPAADGSIDSLLRDATLFPLKEDHKLTLGLSGGMDSRTILALLLNSDRRKWQVHSIGNRNNPDIAVAKQIAEALNIPIRVQYYDPDKSPTVESIVTSLKEYSLHTEMTDSPFGYPRLSLFSDMYGNGYWMTDGGYGELFRRSYGNKLLLSGRAAIRKNDPRSLMRFFALQKSPIFNREVHDMLKRETERQFEAALHAMPKSLSKVDIGDWIDIFHVRYRLKNFGGASQGLYDHCIPNYMPFALSKMISSYMRLPSRERGNNKLNRRIIHDDETILEKLPLISYSTKVPYWTSRNIVLSRAVGKLRKKFAPGPGSVKKSFRVKELEHLKEFVNDRLLAEDVKSFPQYDFEYLRRHVESFYSAPNENDARVIDDWLTFDFWRECLAKR